MTCSRESSRSGGSVTGLVYPLKESTNLGGALQVVGQGALALAHGSLGAGRFVARKSTQVAKAVANRTCRTSAADAVALVSEPAGAGSGRGRRALIVVGVAGAVVAGGVAFFRARRFEHPPVAPEPPRVGPAPVAEVTD